MNRISAGQLSDLPEDAGTCVTDGETRVAVFNVDGQVHAIADRCSHAEASLAEGEVFDGEVECPRHGAAFEIATGAALTLPATKPVATFATEIVDGEVFITIPTEVPA